MRRNSRVTAIAGFAVAVVLLAVGGLLLWGSAYVHNTVQGQLSAQQIYFPAKAAFAQAKAGTEITPSMIPSVAQYAGQQLLTGEQAEAYADHFIAVHITKMPDGDLLPAERCVAGEAEQRQAGRPGRHRVQGGWQDVSVPRYYLWEQRALEGLVAACEPRPVGKAAGRRHQPRSWRRRLLG